MAAHSPDCRNRGCPGCGDEIQHNMKLNQAAAYIKALTDLIRDMDAHEGAEGWSDCLRERINKVLGTKK